MKFLSTARLRPGMRIGQSIIGIEHAENYVIGYTLSEDDIVRLREAGVCGVYVLKNAPEDILSPDLMKSCIAALRRYDLETLSSLSEKIVEERKNQPSGLDFLSVRSYKDYLFHHSICVAVYAVALGMHLDMEDAQLNELALAGLLHDIGLMMADQTVLLKNEMLSQEEYEQVKKHPEQAYYFIRRDRRISQAVLDAVLLHHENVNGSGYPEEHNEDVITLYARILHVVDVYDAIMSKRPYKTGMSGEAAINYLIGGKMILFDERIVDKFLEIAVPYPTGSEVRLSSDEIAVVLEQTTSPGRPLVYIEDKKAVVDLSDCQEYREITIVSDMAHEDFTKTGVAGNSEENNADVARLGISRKKVMIVDDVFVSIASTKGALGDDYDIVTCLGGVRAVAMAKTERPDLILMDYEMPEMDGVMAMNEINKLGLKIPVIFLTGKCDKETVYACRQCGAVDYILKPANPVYLKARVNLALYSKSANALI